MPLCRRAVYLDERTEHAHWALGISCWGLHCLDVGIAALERAVELNRNCSLAYGSLGTALAIAGRVQEAIANQKIAIRMNPRDPSIFVRVSGLALAHYTACDYDAAIHWAERAVHRMPRWYLAHVLLAAGQLALGRSEPARAAVVAARAALPGISVADAERMPMRNPAKMQKFRDRLHAAGFSATPQS